MIGSLQAGYGMVGQGLSGFQQFPPTSMATQPVTNPQPLVAPTTPRAEPVREASAASSKTAEAAQDEADNTELVMAELAKLLKRKK